MGPEKIHGGNTALLTVDVGNSRWKFALTSQSDDASRERRLPDVLHVVAIAPGEAPPWNEFRQECEATGVSVASSILAASDPLGAQRLLETWPSQWPTPLVIESRAALPIDTHVRYPERVGLDRLLNGIAANVLRDADQPAIIVDSGTATTVDLIDAAGGFCGGAILPGFDLGARALHEYTALLPIVRRGDLDPLPPVLGQETTEALASGLYWGQIGGVKELVSRLSESHCDRPPMIIVTGGAGQLLADHLSQPAVAQPHLTLQGLALVHRLDDRR